ncbi:MAG: thrombospondin type 3 repeat-containing protein [Acidobacteriota bacterium]
MKTFLTVLQSCLLLGLIASSAAFAETKEHAYFDTDRNEWLVDTDGDGVVDLTEAIAGTDPYNADDTLSPEPLLVDQRAVAKSAGFPTTSCRTNFVAAGSRLCIDRHEQNSKTYLDAQATCRTRKAHVCSQEDLFYLYRYSTLDSSYNPNGSWLGDAVHDDTVLCGNKSITYNNDPDMFNFEGNCGRTGSRQYWCCHDRE